MSTSSTETQFSEIGSSNGNPYLNEAINESLATGIQRPEILPQNLNYHFAHATPVILSLTFKYRMNAYVLALF